MSQYVDSSALVKLYVQEPDSQVAIQLLETDPDWVSAAHTVVEVRRVLAIRHEGRSLATARAAFLRDWERVIVVELDSTTCANAAVIAEATRMRTLDSLHLAAAMRTVPGHRFITFDARQADAARQFGFAVVGG